MLIDLFYVMGDLLASNPCMGNGVLLLHHQRNEMNALWSLVKPPHTSMQFRNVMWESHQTVSERSCLWFCINQKNKLPYVTMLIQLPKLLDDWLPSQGHLEEHVCQAPQLCVSIVQIRKTPTYEQHIFQISKRYIYITMERQLLLKSLKHLYSTTFCLPIPTYANLPTPILPLFYPEHLAGSGGRWEPWADLLGSQAGVNTSHLHQKPLVKEIAEVIVLKFVSSKMI